MRLNRAQRLMAREEINGILLFDPINIRYLNGYKPTGTLGISVAILMQGKEPCLIVPQTEYSLAKTKSWFRNIQSYEAQPEKRPLPAILTHIKDAFDGQSLRTLDIGVELNYVSARRFEELKRILPDAGFKNISNSMTELRMVKDESEIDKLQTALQMAENGLRVAIEFIQPGISEIEVAAEVERTLRKAGATHTGYPTVIASGHRATCPYAAASQREINSGEFVVISVSAINDDYCSNLTRTVMTGKPSKRRSALFKCATNSVTTARNQLNPETLVRDIALNIRRMADDHGYLNYLSPLMGNGVGLQPIEPPIISATEELLILPGMVFTIEVGFHIPEMGGVRLSDTIVSEKDGFYNTLNRIPLETV